MSESFLWYATRSTAGSSSAEGIGFAIPIDAAASIMAQAQSAAA